MSTSVMELMNEYTKVMYESSKMAADASVKELSADKTIVCTIVNDDDWENGRYLCSYQSGTIWAYALRNEHYEINTVVYVTVPQSDFDKQKFIIGKQMDLDKNEIYNYEFPFEDFVKLDRLCMIEGDFDYRANQSENMLEEDDSSWQITGFSATLDSADGGNRGKAIIGDKLGISMTVRSELESWNPASGNYGAKISVEGYVHNSQGQEDTYKVTEYYFDKYSMYGNVYAYTFPVEQQVVFDISEYATILNVSVNFWQDCQFVDQFNDPINWRNEGGSKVPCNIHISDVSVYTGYKKGELDGNKLYLYTYDKLIYGEDPQGTVARSDLDTRSMFISLIYYNRETGKYILAQTLEDLAGMGAQLYWYIRDESWSNDYISNKVYHDENDVPQQNWVREDYGYAGVFWAPISGLDGAAFPSKIINHTEPVFSNSSVQFLCDINKSRYQFRVAAVIGNDLILSDILTFTNATDVEGLNSNLAINDTVVLRPAMFLNRADGTGRVLYPDEQFQNFFVYDENNRVLHTKDTREIEYNDEDLVGIDNVKYSDIDYFLELWVRADVFGLAQETADEHGYVRVSNWKTNGTDQYVPFTITWDLPDPSFTMLEFTNSNNVIGGIPSSYVGEPYYNVRANYPVQWIGENGLEQKTLFDIDKMTTRVFHVRDSYDMARTHNTVACTIERNGQKFTAKREFLFGRASAQGCDYTPIIQIQQPEGNSYLVTGQPFQIHCYVIDNHGDEVLEPYTVQWSTLGEAPLYSISEDTRTITGTMGNECLPFVLTATVKGLVSWDLHARRGMLITNDSSFLINNTVYCPSRVEFNSSGQAPKYATQKFECRRVGETEEARTYFYPTWHLNTPSNSFGKSIHLVPEPVHLIKYYLVQPNASYDSNKVYAYVDLDMCWHNLDKDDQATFTEYKNKNILFEARSETFAQYYGSDVARAAGALTIEEAPINYTYRLTYDSGENGIQGQTGTAWQWDDAYATDVAYFTWLDFTWTENDSTIKVAQAIAYDRTYYPSSLVNNWDGKSLSLDYENSAIFSTMMAAGTKNLDNKFTGVMMGNWIEHGDSSFDSLNSKENSSGIYGMHNGEFSFAFLDDGTGYIGPAGKGRIQFDGNNALISNSDHTCYLNLNPNRINESGSNFGVNWHNTNGSGISQYFLYCKVPVDVNRLMLQFDERSLSWADPYMNDDDNNYFIVDPVHGALMSGGIVSKYGRIGNWYINSTGLYQKYVHEEAYDNNGNYIGSTKNRFIYLGMPGLSKSQLETIKNHYDLLLQQNETARQNRINNTGDTDLSQTENILHDLYQYLNKSLMSIDVYHYYTSSLAVQMFIDYVTPFIERYDRGEYESTNLLVTDIYNYDNLTNNLTGLYRYDNINQYLHNHYLQTPTTKNGVVYPAGTRTMGSQGLQPNIWKVMGYNGTYISCKITIYISPDDILYQYYTTDYNNSSYYNKSNTYYTINQIGDIRVQSYDPSEYPSAIRTQINRLTMPTNPASDLKLSHDHISQNAMNGHWWEPVQHPDDTDGIIKDKFWHNNAWRTAIQPAQSYMRADQIDLDGLRGWIEEAKIYLYYAQQRYNQVLYRQLETGIEDLEAHKDDSVEALEKYNIAMSIINGYGGLEAIKNAGLSNTAGQNEEFINTLTDEQKARIEKLKLDAINREFDDIATGIKADRAQALRNAYCQEDDQKYAIYAGYNSPWDWSAEDQAWANPLFGVKWNGYLIARQGKIGRDSPWFISDAGLTQRNNFGTIFLGNPEVSGMPISSLEYNRSIQGKEVNFFIDENNEPISDYDLLPNLGYIYFVIDDNYWQSNMITIWSSKEDFANAHPEIEERYLERYKYILKDYTPSSGSQSFTSWAHIYAGDTEGVYYIDFWDRNNNQGNTAVSLVNDILYDYDGNPYRRVEKIFETQGPAAYNEHGAYAIYAGDSLEINFGIRLDGTLFSKRGSIGGWRIEEGQLVNYVHDIPVNNVQNNNEGIALDAETHQIRLHGSDIVLDGSNGVIFMGKPEISSVTVQNGIEVTNYTYNTNSHLIMSNVNITASTIGATSYSSSTAGSTSILTVDATQSSTVGQDWTYDSASGTITYGDGSSSIDANGANTTAIRGSTTIHTITLQAGDITDSQINYNRGFYTICYNQSDALDIPSYGPTVSGDGGLGVAFSSSTKIALYPFTDDSQLGFKINDGNGNLIKYRWNIYATYVTATMVYIEDSNGNRDSVVTKGAFNSAIDAIKADLTALANTCSNNAQDTAYALSVAEKALARANSAIGMAVKKLDFTVSYGDGDKAIAIVATTNNGTTYSSGEFWAASSTHTHVITIGVSNSCDIYGYAGSPTSSGDGEVTSLAGIKGLTNYYEKDQTYNRTEIDELIEKTFKNGWNAAIAALQWTVGSSKISTSSNGAGSTSTSYTISAEGGDGKNSYSRTIEVRLEHSHTEATAGLAGSGVSTTSYCEGYYIPSSQGVDGAVPIYTTKVSGADSHYAYISSASSSSADAYISLSM